MLRSIQTAQPFLAVLQRYLCVYAFHWHNNSRPNTASCSHIFRLTNNRNNTKNRCINTWTALIFLRCLLFKSKKFESFAWIRWHWFREGWKICFIHKLCLLEACAHDRIEEIRALYWFLRLKFRSRIKILPNQPEKKRGEEYKLDGGGRVNKVALKE